MHPVCRRPIHSTKTAFHPLNSVRAGTLLMVALAAWANSSVADEKPFQFKTEVSLKETFDSNVYMQDRDPAPANVAAAQAAGLDPVRANQESLVTTILPKISLDYRPNQAFSIATSYSPDLNYFHSASSENYVAHRGTLNFSGKLGATTWELLNSATYIDGNDQGPTFARPDDIPALGGIPLRDRRSAFVFKNGFRFTQPLGEDWFLRPVASSYIHDFKTEQRYTPPAVRSRYSYENYIDRQEVSGGIDLGYKLEDRTSLILGYRYGRQDQFKGPYGIGGAIIDSPFDCAYHRVLVGVEGQPTDWLKLNVLFGPDIRQFSDEELRNFDRINPSYAAFDPNELLYYADASITLLPTKTDSILIKINRYEQPAFSSFSMYQDIRNDLVWRHQINPQLSAALGFTLYIGDWQPPVHRDDWIYTPNANLTYALTSKLSVDLSYSYDWADSKVPASVEPLTESHEFTRHLASLGVRYAF